MKIAVAGGTGLVGRRTVEAVRRFGHDPLVLARSAGLDLTTGAGLAAALDGVNAVIDVTNTPSVNTDQVRKFFATVTGHLLAAEHHAGVRHHVVLSIVGLDRLPDDGHYAGKWEQERMGLSGPVPASVVRATQFHTLLLSGVLVLPGLALAFALWPAPREDTRTEHLERILKSEG